MNYWGERGCVGTTRLGYERTSDKEEVTAIIVDERTEEEIVIRKVVIKKKMSCL